MEKEGANGLCSGMVEE